MDVSDRRLQVQLTTQTKITSNFSSFEVIFAFVGFVSDLKGNAVPLGSPCKGK